MRRLFSRGLSCVAWAILVAAVGCSGSAGPGLLPDEKLPKIDEATQFTVDDGRTIVASPKGWVRAPKSKDYLVRYQRAGKKPYPTVTVTVADPPSGIKSVGKGDHAAFVEAMAASLAERFTKEGKSSLTIPPTAVQLGDHFAVAWAAPGRSKSGKANESRFNYSLMLDGRLYNVEACGLRNKLGPDGILAAKAVASAISATVTAEPEPAETEPAENADAKKDDEKKDDEKADASKDKDDAAKDKSDGKKTDAEQSKPDAEEAKSDDEPAKDKPAKESKDKKPAKKS